MQPNERVPALLDKEAMGGDIAEGGFSYQNHLLLARIPLWLGSDCFTEMIRESFGDTEAKFYIPGHGTVIEFVEYKNHDLSPSEFWLEIDHFQRMDRGYPNSYWRFMLVCTGVSGKLKPLRNALRRLRDSFPFYAQMPSIQHASYAQFVTIVKELGKDEETAKLLFEKVFIDTDSSRTQAFEIFRRELERHFPIFRNFGTSEAESVWLHLKELVGNKKAQKISRAELESVLFNLSSGQPVKVARPIRLTTFSELPTGGWDIPIKLCFDWSDFSGGENRIFPSTGVWNERIVHELTVTKQWIIESGRSRNIVLEGQRRLSASVAIGAIFNAVSGFNIDMHYRGEVWSTSAHALSDTPDYSWDVLAPKKQSSLELAVIVGIGRNITEDVQAFLIASSLNIPLLVLTSLDAVVSPSQENLAVQRAKQIIQDALSRTGAKILHLFLATPSHFALFLGHRLNAMGTIQCYERVSPSMYHPTCRLSQS